MSGPIERLCLRGSSPGQTGEKSRVLSGFFAGLILAFTVFACSCARPPAPGGLPRADPGRVAWLERQSMLSASAELIRVVSGSDVAWTRPGAEVPSSALLKGSAMWLFAEPQTLLASGRSPLAELGAPERLSLFADLGLSGLFLAPLQASGREWRPERCALTPDTDATSFELATTVGSEEEWRDLAEKAGGCSLLLGTSVLPAFTGLGPDFFLALRAVRDWPGAYVMLEIPPRDWPLLPAGQAALPSGLREDLVARRVLPPLNPPGGPSFPVTWAVSEPVAGQDGRTRRWAYLSAGSPDRPLLNWDDPSATARRLLSASVIRQVGIRRIPLAGLSLGPLFGLSPSGPDDAGLEPGLSALRDLTREIHRYGGWSLLLDRVPPALTPRILESGCDLLLDNVTSPAAEYALLSGDAAPLRTALDGAVARKLDQRRFLRFLSSSQALDFSLPVALSPDQHRPQDPLPLQWKKVPGWKKTTVRASAPALAAARAGLDPGSLSPSWGSVVKAPHEALLLFRAGLPGVLALSGQDLAGVTHSPFRESSPGTPVPEDPTDRVLPAWSPGPETQTSTSGGVPRGLAVYAPLSAQMDDPDSFAATVKRVAAVRRQTGVAAGTLLGRLPTREPGSAAVVVRLPEGGLLLTAVNFSDSVIAESFALPPEAAERARDLLRESDMVAEGGRLHLKLEPFACRMLLFSARTK